MRDITSRRIVELHCTSYAHVPHRTSNDDEQEPDCISLHGLVGSQLVIFRAQIKAARGVLIR